MHSATPTALHGAAPWYAQRWPWLLMLGPAIVLVAGTITGWLAYTRQDHMVVDDYYKRGKAINQDLRRDRVASAMRLSFEASYDAQRGVLAGAITSFGKPMPAPFEINLTHSTLPSKDIRLHTVPDAAGRFEVALPVLEQARWQVTVEGAQGGWRLASEWRWPAQQAVAIDADQAVSK